MSEGIGAPVKRKEDKRFTTGAGRYTDDIRMQNQAYCAFVRSPHAHAKVKGINAAAAEGEGAWRMPLGAAYDKMLKAHIADMKNVGGRPAGSITAAQFLQRFVQEGQPWIHLDIAGTASVKAETAYAGAGATGWGVMALNRFVADQYEA